MRRADGRRRAGPVAVVGAGAVGGRRPRAAPGRLVRRAFPARLRAHRAGCGHRPAVRAPRRRRNLPVAGDPQPHRRGVRPAPHPEGGWFRRTWASGVEVSRSAEVRPTATSIYFLLAPGRTSEWHTVASDELWFWHRGGPLTLSLGGTGERPGEEPGTVVLGGGAGQVPQAVVPGGTWQRATASATAETLVSCVVSPGFDFADFRTL
ncbi:cupin domain-containing protein [Saccharopolyspora spinosporotrichia]